MPTLNPTQSLLVIYKMPFSALLIFSIVAILSAYAVSGPKKDPPWVEKDWTQWNTNDVWDVLNRSPWGFSSEFDNGSQKDTNSFQLRSALPIREALLRELQTQNHYDKMIPQEKQAFDLKHADEIKETDDDPILYFLGNGAHVDPVPTGELYPPVEPAIEPPAIALQLSDGTLVMPSQITVLHYDLSEKDYQFTFPRRINGRPVVAASDKYLSFATGERLPPIPITKKQGPMNLGPMKREDFHLVPLSKNEKPFSIASLMYKGKLEY
jgi:hypothetical protein